MKKQTTSFKKVGALSLSVGMSLSVVLTSGCVNKPTTTADDNGVYTTQQTAEQIAAAQKLKLEQERLAAEAKLQEEAQLAEAARLKAEAEALAAAQVVTQAVDLDAQYTAPETTSGYSDNAGTITETGYYDEQGNFIAGTFDENGYFIASDASSSAMNTATTYDSNVYYGDGYAQYGSYDGAYSGETYSESGYVDGANYNAYGNDNGYNNGYSNTSPYSDLYDGTIASQIIYFAFNQDTIVPQAHATLDAHADYLKANTWLNARLEGHADERGTRDYNIALSERRAKAIKRYLEIKGVSRSQLEVISYGEEKPLQLGNNEAAWSKNRRVEIKY